MQEKTIENHLIHAVRQHGGLCPKFTSPGTAGMPDRLIILPGKPTAYAELKAPGQKPRPIQTRRHQQLRDLGCHVYIIDNPNQIPQVIHEIQTT